MCSCFILFDSPGKPGRVYALSNNVLTLLQNPGVQFAVPLGNDPISAIRDHEQKTWSRVPSSYEIVQRDLNVGRFFPSIARPVYPGPGEGCFNPNAEQEKEIIKNTWRELEIITHDLEQCFNVNSPFADNFLAFGIYYERLIYFACIGVEALFRKVFEDNMIAVDRFNMTHFVKLEPHLRLREYSVTLQRYPWLKPIQPYVQWSATNPSLSLPWFNAYNMLKHDKRNNERQANMQNALLCASAYYILSHAIFGRSILPGFFSNHFYFLLSSVPTWDLHEFYFESDDKSWKPMLLNL